MAATLGNVFQRGGPAGDALALDLPRLLETRMLVQANSGGGKSWALRRLLEQTASSVQQLVIDPEGEFATLREEFDYVIAAPHDADVVANPKTATLLARRLLETGVSAVLDIYDLKAGERQAFVRRLLEGLVNAPRKLWHPVLLVIDEAHVFCPQTGGAEAAPAVIDVCTRGRKRGLCAVLATQRLSKLHKDAAAEMLNKLVGRTGLDIDVKRAADELGMSTSEQRGWIRQQRPGEFFAFGPALSTEVTRVRVGEVQTTHPQAGQRLMAPPPAATKRIRESLAKLADLQAEAEKEAADLESMRAEITRLQRELAAAQRAAGKPAASGPSPAEIQQMVNAAVEAERRRAKAQWAPGEKVQALVGELAKIVLPDAPTLVSGDVKLDLSALAKAGPGPVIASPRSARAAPTPVAPADGVSAPQQRILDVLAQFEVFGLPDADKSMVAVHAGASPTSGGYFNNLGRLRSAGLVDYPAGGRVALTDEGRAKANPPAATPTLEELHDSWYRLLPAPQAAILRALVEVYPEALGKDDLADRVGVSRTSGGYFNNLGRLRTLGAIDYPQRGTARAAAILFPEASRG